MLIRRAYKTEAAPTPAQAEAFHRHAGVARFVWNWGLGRLQEIYQETGRFPTVYALKKELNEVKASEYPWIAEVSTYAAQSAFDNLGKAMANFLRERKKFQAGQRTEPPGFPQFKSRDKARKRFRLYGIIRVLPAAMKLDNVGVVDAIQLPSLGIVALKEAGYLPTTEARILNVTISEEGRRWFVSLQVEQEVPDPPAREESSVGVAMGTGKILATCSDGREFENPRTLWSADHRANGREISHAKNLARLNRRRDRQQPGSKNRKKTVDRLAREHYEVACKRRDALHQASAAITNEHTTVSIKRPPVGSLPIKDEMQRSHNSAKLLSDAALGEFERQLRYKEEWKGGGVVEVEKAAVPAGVCGACGAVQSKPSKTKKFACEVCGFAAKRKENEAILIQKRGESTKV